MGFGEFTGRLRRSQRMVGGVFGGLSGAGTVIRRNQVSWCSIGFSTTREPPADLPPFVDLEVDAVAFTRE